MKKELKKIIKKLTKSVGASPAFLKNGVKNLLVIGAIDKVGLITVLDCIPARWSLGLGLNFHSFKVGIAGTLKEIIPAPTYNFFNEVKI